MTEKNVYFLINAVIEKLSKIGIAKDHEVKPTEGARGPRYKFRGIDDIYNNLAPILAESGLVIIPRMTNSKVIEHIDAGGKKKFQITVDAEFDLISPFDKSQHTARTIGEGMDNSDKGFNKAMSAAYKAMAIQLFCIPTEGNNDTENENNEVTVFYQDDHFEDKFNTWKGLIESGSKDAEKIIAFIESKGQPLTESQKKRLLSVKTNPVINYNYISDSIRDAKTVDQIDVAASLISELKDGKHREELKKMCDAKRAGMEE